MRSHSRSRSPEGSFQGTPLSCTRRPGACPTMRTRAVGEARSTGLGGLGRWASQILHARTSASRRSNWAGSTRMIKSVLFAIRAPLMPPHSPPSPLNALSPLDGRYHKQLEPLRACFGEAALFRYRIAVEIRWLLAIAAEPAIVEIKPFSKATHAELERIIENFSEEDVAQVKAVEAETNHDVKAIEYWLKKRLAGNPEGARVAHGGRRGACDRGAPAAPRAALHRLGRPAGDAERRGGQLHRPRARVPELRLRGLREAEHVGARPREPLPVEARVRGDVGGL